MNNIFFRRTDSQTCIITIIVFKKKTFYSNWFLSDAAHMVFLFLSIKPSQRFSWMIATLPPTVTYHWLSVHHCWAWQSGSPSLTSAPIRREALGSRSPCRRKCFIWSLKIWKWNQSSWVVDLYRPRWNWFSETSLVCGPNRLVFQLFVFNIY